MNWKGAAPYNICKCTGEQLYVYTGLFGFTSLTLFYYNMQIKAVKNKEKVFGSLRSAPEGITGIYEHHMKAPWERPETAESKRERPGPTQTETRIFCGVQQETETTEPGLKKPGPGVELKAEPQWTCGAARR